jgi:hypothetical protein
MELLKLVTPCLKKQFYVTFRRNVAFEDFLPKNKKTGFLRASFLDALFNKNVVNYLHRSISIIQLPTKYCNVFKWMIKLFSLSYMVYIDRFG